MSRSQASLRLAPAHEGGIVIGVACCCVVFLVMSAGLSAWGEARATIPTAAASDAGTTSDDAPHLVLEPVSSAVSAATQRGAE